MTVMLRTAPALARRFSTASKREVKKEVIISQSQDLVSNVALEDWMLRHVDLRQKSLLILTNSIIGDSTMEIKATMLDEETLGKVKELEELVLSSLSPSLPLARLPAVSRMCELTDSTSLSVSLQLEVSRRGERLAVLHTMETLGWRFLLGRGHLSLVRPDEDWFPGLGRIKSELSHCLALVGQQDGQAVTGRGEITDLQSSFGQ